MKSPSKKQAVFGSVSIVSLGAALLLWFQLEPEIDKRTTTAIELSAAVDGALLAHYQAQTEPLQKDVEQMRRRFDRDDFKNYLIKVCEMDQALAPVERDDFDEILDRLGYERAQPRDYC